MGRVLIVSEDLMFPSNLAGSLAAAGIEAAIASSAAACGALGAGDLAIFDLTQPGVDPAALRRAVPDGVRTIAFFAHVEPEVREAALQAGIEAVYPRSRVAREGATLIGAALA